MRMRLGVERRSIQNGDWDTDAALGIRGLAEMLEIHLAEVKHQGELKLQHPELPAHGRVLQTKH
jgi:hypothetical protein